MTTNRTKPDTRVDKERVAEEEQMATTKTEPSASQAQADRKAQAQGMPDACWNLAKRFCPPESACSYPMRCQLTERSQEATADEDRTAPQPWRIVADDKGLVHIHDADGSPVTAIGSTCRFPSEDRANATLMVAAVNAAHARGHAT